MPKFQISAPDGQKYEVNAPEGSTEQDAIAYVQNNIHTPKASPQAAAPQANMPISERIGQGIRDPIDAGAQLLTHVLPQGIVDKGNQLNNWLADKTGLVGKIPENNINALIAGQKGGLDAKISQDEQAYQQRRQAAGQSGLDAYRLLGNIISPANLAIASRIPAGATLAQKIGAGIAGGAGLNATTQPVIGAENPSTNFPMEKAKQAAIGAATGPLGQIMGAGLNRIISPKASVNPNMQLLQESGVNPTIGQTLGGVANKLEEKATSIPILGDMISLARGNANNQFERAAYNQVLAPINTKLPLGLKGRDALNFTESTLKNRYDNVLNNIGAITPDAQFGNDVTQLSGMVDSLKIPQANKDKFAYLLDNIKSAADENGVITSDAYKRLESSLGSNAKKLGGSPDIYDGDIAQAAAQLQANLKDMLARQAGPEAKALQDTNAAWANFKRVQNAAGKVGAEEGAFNPAQLQNAVRTMDKSKDKAAFARGNALMQDLSEAGKTVLGNKVPNSFTTDRALLAGGTLGSYLVNPAIPAGLLGGAALYTQPAQKALNALVSKRPDSAAQLAELLRQNSNYILPASGALGFGLLN